MRETVSMKVWAAARSLSKSVLLLSAFLTVAGCANSGKGRVYLLPEQRLVSGIIQPGKDISLANLEVSLITPAGMRSTPTGLKLDSKNGNFSFTLPDSATVQSSDGGVIEQLLSMGGFLPDMVRPGSALVGQVLKYARFEIRSKNFEDKDYQKIPYAQLLLPLERRNTLSGTDALNFGSPLSISSAGFVKVTVRDLKSGVALPNVQIAAVSDGKTTANIPVWQAAQVRPIFSTTDANGVAIVGPIDASLELTRFKFLARASGYCTYLGDAKIFGLSRTDKHTVNLRPCDAQDTTISTLLPTFPTNLKYLKSVDTAKVTRDVLFTSSANDTTLKCGLTQPQGFSESLPGKFLPQLLHTQRARINLRKLEHWIPSKANL